jgi:hypothetical protein
MGERFASWLVFVGLRSSFVANPILIFARLG